MKKTAVAIVLIIISLFTSFIFVGCSSEMTPEEEYEHKMSFTHTMNKDDPMENIPGKTYLVYDTDTLVIYYKLSEVRQDKEGFGYMSPYLSENGYYCKYIDGEIVEIVR